MRTSLALIALVFSLVVAGAAAAEDAPGRTAFGPIAALSADSLTVQPEHGDVLTCSVPAERQALFAKLDLKVGQRVAIRCRQTDAGFVLVGIAPVPPPPPRSGRDGGHKKPPPPAPVRLVKGTLAALAADSLTVRQDNGESVTCGIPAPQQSAVAGLGLQPGDHVVAACRRDGGRWLLVSIRRA